MILLTLVVTLGVVCGVIAYVGDYLGKRLGKKRVSLLGLRPRQTAVLISVTTGVCIFLLAFASILLADQNARQALLAYDQTVRDNRTLAQQNRQLTAANGSLRAANQGLEQDRHRLEQEKSHLLAEMEPLRQELKKNETRLLQTERTLRAKQEDLRQTSDALKQTKQDLEQIKQALHTIETALNTAKAELTDTQKQVKEQHKLLEKGRDIVFEIGRQNLTLERQRDALRTEVQKLTDEVQQLAQERNVLKGIVEKLIRDQVIIGANEVIASRTIRETQDTEHVYRALTQLLAEANRIAQTRGAASSEEQKSPLMLATRVVVVGDVRGYIHEEQIVDRTAEDIIKSKHSWVVDIVAVRNFVAGEPVQARLALSPNQQVFTKGDYILTQEVNCSQHKAGIFHDILNLLEEAKQFAEAQGVRPRQEHAYADGTNEKIFDLLDRLHARSGRVRVSVVAAQDLWTADQLSVRFEIATSSESRP